MRIDDLSGKLNDPGKSPSDDSLERHCAGRCTPAEQTEIERWLEADPHRTTVVQAIARELSPRPPAFDVEAMLSRTHTRIAEAERRVASPVRRLSRFVVMPRIAFAAAVAVLLGAVGITISRRIIPHDSRAGTIGGARELVATPGRQAVIDLKDGSQVVLAPGSRLRIPADFNVRTGRVTRREVTLEGKARFRVEHDGRRPFIVRTMNAVTEDVGTEFVVRAYPENRTTQVVVVSGTVALRPLDSASVPRTPRARERAPIVLEPGDLAEVDSNGTMTLSRNVDVDSYVSWTQGVLLFDATRLGTALADLGRWYDVDFKLDAPGLDSLRVSGEFRNESIDAAMQRLEIMLGVRVVRDGRTVVLSVLSTQR